MRKILLVFFAIMIFANIIAPQVNIAYATQLAPAPSTAPAAAAGLWVVDPEVTFIGKNAARAGLLLDWTLQNYNWVCVTKVANRQCDDSNNPLAKFWGTIVLFIVVPLLFVVILATAIIIIITRGRSLTIMRFIPRFVAVILLIVFSYSILQFLYQFTDLIQGFFLRADPLNVQPCPPTCVSQKDLLYVGWDYRSFIGLRLLGDYNAESAFISLLLTKLTALTYFVMVGILLMRKIILWFFIIVSPVFPLLLLYYPVRNTGKIWIGEFFRWLLYAPLFAMFLKGLVFMWRNQIPLVFTNPDIGNGSKIIFPTAVNILLGGPRQFVTPTNSVNLTETFALYVVALIMLWIVILLPWILLQIFLDYAANFAAGDNAAVKKIMNLVSNKVVPPGSPSGYGPQPPGGGGAGEALSLPFAKKFNIPVSMNPTYKPAGAAKEIPTGTTVVNSRFAQPVSLPVSQVNAEVMSLSNMSLPSMRDIAKYETALISNDTSRQQEVMQSRETLERIANPVSIASSNEREKYIEIHDRLVTESGKGNMVATSVLNAANVASRNSISASNSQLKNTLQQIANPASITSSTDREKLTKLHDTLAKESSQNKSELASSLLSVSQNSSDKEIEKIKESLMQASSSGNSLANSVISNVNNAAQQSQSATQIKNILQQIANPAAVTNVADKARFSQLHETLERESKQNNNSLATSILSVTDTTSVSELSKIKEQLSQQKENSVLTTVNTVVQQTQANNQIKSVIQQVANPASATNPVEREKMTKLHTALQQESQKGNDLATSLLGASSTTSAQDMDKLKDKLMQAKEQGSPLATQILSMTNQASQTSLPTVNRVQTVRQEDYEDVKKMWKENYHDLEVPQGMAGNRTEWMKDDIEKINNIVDLLSSTDQEKVTEGMDQVSNILPFLLVGGFSQTEIIAYLKSKQDAAKETLQEVTTEEEETTVSVERKEHAQASATMTASIEAPTSTSESEDISPLETIQSTTINQPQINVSNDILQMVNLKVPKMRDIAHYETMALKKDKTEVHEIQTMHEMLERIANPTSATQGVEREKYEKLKEKLIAESQKGNTTANIILSAASSAAQSASSSVKIKNVFQQIIDPTITIEKDKQKFTELHNQLTQASEQGNKLATSILAVKETSTPEELENLSKQLKDAKQNGEIIATAVLSNVPAVVLPTTNNVQTVSEDDFAEVKKMWEENYRTMPVPLGFADDKQGRIDWIKKDTEEIQETITLLSASDTEKISEGMKKVEDILPFLLLGGFSNQEIMGYLKAKQEAGKSVLAELQEDVQTQLTVPAGQNATEPQKHMAAEIENKEKN